ncbi:MAG: flagellar basal body P-ring protein FlgI, partial [Mariniblastus sp.]
MTLHNDSSANKARNNHRQLLKVGRRVFLAGLVVSVSGCQNMIRRGQSPDDAPILQLYDENKKSSDTKYIGDVCGIYGLNFSAVEGIGLAKGLKGKGSPAKAGSHRDHVLRALEMKPGDVDSKKALASRNTEIVLMKGLLPPGIRAGDTFDLEVSVMPNSDAESIEDGMLLQTRMQVAKKLGGSVKFGHVEALGRGRILVDALFETRKDKPNHLHGVVLGGGKALEDRPLGLVVRVATVSPKTTTYISRAINSRFSTRSEAGRMGVAEPKDDRRVDLLVPDAYRHNVGRYLAVVKNLTYSEPDTKRVERLEELDEQMGQPSASALTALRLEAMGKSGIPSLKRALRHKDLEVQFHAAQALSYLGQTDGVDILKKAAKQEPAFRWHSLTALASLDDLTSAKALEELLHVNSAETRYGAFRSLRVQAPTGPITSGRWLAGDFFLHEIQSKAEPMMHFSRSKRPEIVVFGDQQTVADNFIHAQPGLTVRAIGDSKVSVTAFSEEFGKEKTICSNRVSDLVETLAEKGYGYGSLLKIFREAKKSDTVNTRLVVNAVPKLGRTYTPDEF